MSDQDLLRPGVQPTKIKVKRLNRLPLFIVFTLGFLVLLAFIYMIYKSSQRQQHQLSDAESPAHVNDDMLAENILANKQQYGVIEERPGIAPTVVNQPTVKPTPAKDNPVSDWRKEIDKIRKAKFKKFEEALSSPSKIKLDSMFGGSNKVDGSQFATALAATEMPLDFDSLRKKLTKGLDPDADQNKQEHKKQFLMDGQPITEYLPHMRNRQQTPLEVKTGTVIPATMLSGLNSDLPGMILAQVSQHVYDTASGNYLLIPQGSRLIGTYDNFITYGQSRALVVWKRIVYPDGSTLDLEGMPGTDQSGYGGLEDQVDNHYFRIFSSAMLISIITGMYDYSQNSCNRYGGEERTAGDTLASSVAREMSQMSQALLRKNLNIQPTIKIRPGYKLNVMVNKDIIFPAVW